MEIQFYGANCLRLSTKQANVVIDDNLKELGKKSVTKDGDIVLFTGQHGDNPEGAKMVIDEPGEYEVSDISIKGISTRGHMEEASSNQATVFQIIAEDIRVAVIGHIYPQLNEEQLEKLGVIDIMLIPVGGSGYTLDPLGALKIIKEVEPKIIVPTHYGDSSLKYPVPQLSLEEALRGLSMEVAETLPKLKLKQGEISDITKVIVLET